MAIRKILHITVLGLGASLLTSQAHAVAIWDATIQNPTGGLESSNAAWLGMGKIKNANIDKLPGLFAGDPWSLLDRTNKTSKPFNDVNFLLSADTGQRSGEWRVGWDGFDLPAYMDYVLVLKSGKQWGAYLFDSASLLADSQDVNGTFGISWLNKKGKVAKLRHASIFGRMAEAPVDTAASADDETGDTGGESGVGGSQTEASGTGSGLSEGTTGITGGEAGDAGSSAGDAGSDASAAVGPDSDPVPVPGTLVLLAMGLGLGLRQLRSCTK